MRKPIETTYVISVEAYSLLFDCCEKYYNNLAWKYPDYCPDGYGCCGMDFQKFSLAMKFEIPELFRDYNSRITKPTTQWNGDTDEYDQYSLLDLIEYIANNCKDFEIGGYHEFFKHHHIEFKESSYVFRQFKDDINDIFTKTGLLYELTNDKTIERIVQNSPLTKEVEAYVLSVKEDETKKLLKEAIALHKSPYPNSPRDAAEKIWDAFERLKTYYTTLNKRQSAEKIVTDMSNGKQEFVDLVNTEFRALTDIGNQYRIRHHETDKIDVTDNRHYDYFFNRCLSLIALAIQYLK